MGTERLKSIATMKTSKSKLSKPIKQTLQLAATIWLFIAAISQAQTLPAKLTFVIYLPQSAPFMYIDEKQQVSGIVTDIVQRFAAQNGLHFDTVLSNRVRAEQDLYAGTVDVGLFSPEWLTNPENLVFTKPIFNAKDRFYGNTENDVANINSETLKDKIICTREYYRYPMLDTLSNKGNIVRLDVSDEYNQLLMLKQKRCDLAYLNEWRAQYLINSNHWHNNIVASPTAFDSANGVLAFHPRWAPHLAKINAYIDETIAAGTLNQLLKKYDIH